MKFTRDVLNFTMKLLALATPLQSFGGEFVLYFTLIA